MNRIAKSSEAEPALGLPDRDVAGSRKQDCQREDAGGDSGTGSLGLRYDAG